MHKAHLAQTSAHTCPGRTALDAHHQHAHLFECSGDLCTWKPAFPSRQNCWYFRNCNNWEILIKFFKFYFTDFPFPAHHLLGSHQSSQQDGSFRPIWIKP